MFSSVSARTDALNVPDMVQLYCSRDLLRTVTALQVSLDAQSLRQSPDEELQLF